MRLILFALLCILPMLTAMADPAPSRIAVISDANTTDLAALVTTELSNDPDIVLVERDALSKIGDELKLQQLAGNDAVALGKLINADGLVFLSKEPDGLHLRFTAVGLGYALFDDQVAASENPGQLAKSIAHRVAGYAPKLKLDPTKAIPLSVLNLRADYATADATELERKLTLLLESRIASLPEYVVLERRHAWSLGFEHSVSVADKPLLQGAYVVDGALTLPAAGASDLTIHLRLRSPNDQITPLEIKGTTDDLHGFVEQMAVAIEKATGTTAALPPWQSQTEARQYLMEGIWASHHGTCEETIEALDSAELLGETAPDVLAIRIPNLCTEAVSGMSPTIYGITPRTTANPGIDERVELVRRLMADQIRYENEHLEGKLQIIDSYHSGEGRTGTLHGTVGQTASKVLVLLDNANDPRAGELRSAIRAFENYDPLNGKIPADWGTALSFADTWSNSMDEELAYYRKIFEAYPNPAWSNFLLDAVLSPEKFGARFLATKEMRSAASLKFFQDLRDDPMARPLALYYLAQGADPSRKDDARHDFYNELWAQHEDLLKANRLGHFLRLAFQMEKDRAVTTADPKLIALLHYYLQQDASFTDVTLNVWHPEFFPADEAPGLFQDLQAYEKRAAAASGHTGYFDSMNRSYLDRFGNPNSQPATKPYLTVTKFWCPWLSTDWPIGDFTIRLMDADPDGLWISGFGSYLKLGLFRVNLPDLKTKIIDSPDPSWPQTLKWTPDALYVTYHLHTSTGPAGEPRIARLDLKTSTWTVRPLPNYFACNLFSVGNTLYLYLNVQFASNEAAIARYDWDHDKFTILASSRRLPAQSQFDNTPNYVIDGIFPGPKDQVCLTCYAGDSPGTFYLQEGNGAWPAAFDGSFANKALTVFDQTLVLNREGEVTFIDPEKSEPEHWMAPSEPHVRKQPPRGTKPVKEMTPWLAQTLWDTPGMLIQPEIVAFHGDYFFILAAPKSAADGFDLLCYEKGKGRSPRHILLQFHLDDAARAALSKVVNNRLRGSWDLNNIEHPSWLPLVTTNQGLCFKLSNAGFWFLPYNEIEAYLATNSP